MESLRGQLVALRERPVAIAPCWNRAELSGRLVELSGQGAIANLTAAIALVCETQQEGELVAWIALTGSTFFPPDVDQCGVDLGSLVVVHVQNSRQATRAADRLIRSGAFALIVLDLKLCARGKQVSIPVASQGRLVGLAQRHETAIVCITESPIDAPSLGSMVSLRAEALRLHADGNHFRCKISVVKDKLRGPNWNHIEHVHGPAGLY